MVRLGIWREYIDARYSRSDIKYKPFSNPIDLKSITVRGFPNSSTLPSSGHATGFPHMAPSPTYITSSPAGGHKPCLELRIKNEHGEYIIEGAGMLFTEDDKWLFDPPLPVGDNVGWTYNIVMEMQCWGLEVESIEVEVVYLVHDVSRSEETTVEPKPDIKKEVDQRFQKYLEDMWAIDEVKQ